MAKKKSTGVGPKQYQADVLRLGQQVADTKAQADPKVWSRFVKSAHKQGFTVSGMLSGAAPALRERTQQSLAQEATKSVATAYQPVTDNLSAQQRQIAAWDEKRKADNQAYSTWLAAQTDRLNTEAQARDGLLASKASELAGTVKAAWDSARTTAQQAAQGAPGNVSDMSQSTALQGLQAGQDKAVADAGSQGLRALDQVYTQGQQRDAGTQASGQFVSELEGRRQADISQATKALRDQSAQVAIDKGNAYLSQLTHLKDSELTKAQYNTDITTARDKLELSSQQLQLSNAKFKETKAQNQRTEADKAASRAIQEGKLALDKGKADLDGDGKVTQADYDLKKKIDAKYSKTKGKNGGPTSGDISYSRRQSQILNNTFSQLTDLNANPKGHTPDTFRHVLITRGAQNGMIDLAEAARRNNGRIPRSLYAKAKALGILDPASVQL